jgi:hypothetical protein
MWGRCPVLSLSHHHSRPVFFTTSPWTGHSANHDIARRALGQSFQLSKMQYDDGYEGSVDRSVEHGYLTPPASTDKLSIYPGTRDFREHFIRPSSRQETFNYTILLENTIATFVASELDVKDSLLDLVVLTGDVHKIWAARCREYVVRTWPEVSGQILQLFDLISRPTESLSRWLDINSVPAEPAGRIHVSQKKKRLRLNVQANRDFVIGITESISWLFAALHSTGELGFSYVRLEPQRGQARHTFALFHHDLIPVSRSDSAPASMCWTSVVPNTAIAGGFDVPERSLDLKGLEVSFEMLLCLCGVEYEIVEEGGIVLCGPKSAVFPVRVVNNNCVQWHLKTGDDTIVSHQDRAEVLSLLDDLEKLKEFKRHFLGLWAAPEITLGTLEAESSRYLWSRAGEESQERIHHGRQIGGTISLPKVLALSWTETYTIASTRKSPYVFDFLSKLHMMINSPVVLYSVSEKRAWLVSFVSVLLDLARARAKIQSELGFWIPPCEASADGGRAAFNAIRNCYLKPLKSIYESNEQIDDSEGQTTIKDYINQVFAALECATRETHKTKHALRTQIVGYEMADIAKMKPVLHMKRHALDPHTIATGWTYLLSEVRLALFCEGIVDPIRAKHSSQKRDACPRCDWRRIPHGFNILTASLPCLIDVSERLPWPNLTPTQEWHNPDRSRTVFGTCNRNPESPCNRLQELKRNGSSNYGGGGPSHSTVMEHKTGAIVFKFAEGMDKISQQVLEQCIQPSAAASLRDRYKPPPTSFRGTALPRAQGPDSSPLPTSTATTSTASTTTRTTSLSRTASPARTATTARTASTARTTVTTGSMPYEDRPLPQVPAPQYTPRSGRQQTPYYYQPAPTTQTYQQTPSPGRPRWRVPGYVNHQPAPQTSQIPQDATYQPPQMPTFQTAPEPQTYERDRQHRRSRSRVPRYAEPPPVIQMSHGPQYETHSYQPRRPQTAQTDPAARGRSQTSRHAESRYAESSPGRRSLLPSLSPAPAPSPLPVREQGRRKRSEKSVRKDTHRFVMKFIFWTTT